jgi:hypothetical protein
VTGDDGVTVENLAFLILRLDSFQDVPLVPATWQTTILLHAFRFVKQ